MQRIMLVLTISLILVALHGSDSQKLTSKREPEQSHAGSIAELVYMLKLKALLLLFLQKYMWELQNKLTMVYGALEHMKAQLNMHEQNAISEFSPFIRYAMLRHLTMDWPQWLTFMKNLEIEAIREDLQHYRRYCPTKKDLADGAESILRIVDTYKLRPQDVANGLLFGKQYDATFTAVDCYALGQYANSNEYYEIASQWFRLGTVTSPYTPWPELLGFGRTRCWQAYAASLLQINRNADAWSALGKALSMAPHDIGLYRQWQHVKSQIFVRKNSTAKKYDFNFETFRSLCRGELVHVPELHCHYYYGTSIEESFLWLAPFKVEPLYLDPYVAVYHDVIYESEIEEIKELSMPNLEASETIVTSKAPLSDRVSKGAFLTHDAGIYTARIMQRITDMTGLSMKGRDLLYVLNYGLGGCYGPHKDYFDGEDAFNNNRIATVLFYLNNVPRGGSTVFTYLNLTVVPKKGSAIYWHNMDKKLNVDPRAEHGGCPVIFGSKWVATKWVNNIEQPFRWPCMA